MTEHHAASDHEVPREDLLKVISTIQDIPDGKEIIGKGHLICHPLWHYVRIQEPDLPFKTAARRYCGNAHPDKVAITVWDGVEAITYTRNSEVTPAQSSKIAKELNEWFEQHGIEARSVTLI